MLRRRTHPARRLRIAVERLPRRTREAMLRGIETSRIIVGAYVDPRSGGVCPMLAAHRNGGRTSVASFARAWDAYTSARRPRPATARELRTLRSLLEASLVRDDPFEASSIAELAAQLRAERARLGVAPTSQDRIRIRRRPAAEPAEPPLRDLLAAAEEELAATQGDPAIVARTEPDLASAEPRRR